MEVSSSASDRETFWRSLFSDLASAGVFPGATSLTGERISVRTAQMSVPLEKVVTAPVELETLLLAAWSVALSRHTSSADVVFLTSFAPEHLGMVRTIVPPKSTPAAWLPEFEGWLRTAKDHGPIPVPYLAQYKEDGFLTRMPSLQIVSAPDKALEIEGPLMVIARLDTMQVELHYDISWFDESEIQALGDHLNNILSAMTETPERAIGTLPLLTEKERARLLDQWNDTAVPFEENTCIHHFFEAQAVRTPDAVAVVFCDSQWTYRELNEQADRVAGRLRAAGVGPGTFVAICLNRSLELMAALFAVFKAGAAYVPLDPSYPSERLTFMIEDAKPAVIVVSKQTANLFTPPGQRLFFIDSDGEPKVPSSTSSPQSSSDPAYLLYTSGSTGKPKGVIVTHRNVSNFFTAMDAVIGTEPGVWLAVTSVNFDISVFELFWTMARGFRIILQEEGQWASQSGSKFSLPEQMRRHGVTHLQCTPSLAALLICDADSVAALAPLRRFMVGGEPLPLDLAQRLSQIIAGDLFNLYGPTETTVWSASQHVARGEKQILIGRPVANTQLYVLDPEGELAPIGSVGELHIGGAGLAREYLHRPDITAEKFITHTFAPGRVERIYRTGDLVRYTRDGRLEFMGRIDSQIKIRGVRIELGEIEMVLREHDDIRDAVVIVHESGDDKRLVAYAVASTAAAPSAPSVLEWLGTKLPKALVPSMLMFLPEFPKTPNGKLDRRALPKPEQQPTAPSAETEVPSNDLEKQIAAIWADALGLASVGLDDRFFDIGGHSLLMVEVHDQLRDKTGTQVALLDLFQFPTVRSLAQHMQKGQKEGAPASGMNRGKMRQQLAARQNKLLKSMTSSP
jgi:amino acid adenylation domain-containing protein